jgi:hypothetical protein
MSETSHTTKEKNNMIDNTHTGPVTEADIAGVTIAGLPALIRRMLDHGSEPEGETGVAVEEPETTQ